LDKVAASLAAGRGADSGAIVLKGKSFK
jgi:hypothetical protein